MPNDHSLFRLETDASDFATGAVLEQLGEDNLWHPVAFLSKSLNEHERDYEIYDKELVAMIRALEEYCHYLEGHPEPVEIWSDHLNLTYFCQAQKLTHCQARWCYDWVSSEEGKTSETGRSAELAFVQRDWS